MNDTPLTDAAYWAAYPNGGDGWDFARGLERNLIVATELLHDVRSWISTDYVVNPELIAAIVEFLAIRKDYPSTIHAPQNLKEHISSPMCWCEPKQDEEEQSLWIHNEQQRT